MFDFEVQRCSRHCAKTERTLQPGETYYTALMVEGADVVPAQANDGTIKAIRSNDSVRNPFIPTPFGLQSAASPYSPDELQAILEEGLDGFRPLGSPRWVNSARGF